MKGFLFLLFLAPMAFAVSGKAISLRLHTQTAWGTPRNFTTLQMDAGFSPLDSFDFWNDQSVQADIRIVRQWPASATPLLKATLRLGFSCNLIKNNLAKSTLIAGPCGMPVQFEEIGEATPILSNMDWTLVYGAPIAPKISRFINFMFPTNAQMQFELNGVDSVDVLITNWKTDHIPISAPTEENQLDRLFVWDDFGSELAIVDTEIPSALLPYQKSSRNSHSFQHAPKNAKRFDLCGRVK